MKKKQKCKIVEDLFGLYSEGLTSENTKNMIEEHLKECEQCQEKYERHLLQLEENELDEKRTREKFKRKLLRYRYQLLGMVIGIVAMVVGVVLCVLGVSFGARIINKANDSFTEKVEDYGEFENYTGVSKLYLFPLKKDMDIHNMELEKYVYECSGGSWYPNCQIYLECKYTKESYLEETERLKNIENLDTEKKVRENGAEFSYPGVYAMLNEEYEYVLFIEEEQKIIYVYLQGSVDRRDLKFPEKYLPLEYGQTGFNYEDRETYSIY